MGFMSPQKVDEASSEQRLPLGTRYFDESTGKVYYYIKAGGAIALGEILTPLLAIFDGDCDASVGAVLNDAAETFTIAAVGAFVKINVGTNSINDAPNRVTKLVTVNQLQLENEWSADLATSEDYVIYHPFIVKETSAAAQIIVGVALVALADGEYGWMQSGGYIDAVKVIGATDPLAANEGIVSSSTAGTGKGLTAGGTTVDEAEKANITALMASALTQLQPAQLNCLP